MCRLCVSLLAASRCRSVGVQKHVDLLVFKDDWDKQGDCDTYTHAHHSHILMQRYLLRQEGACSALSSRQQLDV